MVENAAPALWDIHRPMAASGAAGILAAGAMEKNAAVVVAGSAEVYKRI